MVTQDLELLVSEFPFPPPRGYCWLIERKIAGFEPNSTLQPWYFLPHGQLFSVSEMWPEAAGERELFAFARRQDCDDLACFELNDGGPSIAVVVVHGWTPSGFEVVDSFESIWEWLIGVVKDIEEWVNLDTE